MNWPLWRSALMEIMQGTASFALIWLLQSTFLILAGLAVARLLRRRGAATEFVVYATTLVALLACPLLTWGFSRSGLTQWSVAASLPQATPPAKIPTFVAKRTPPADDGLDSDHSGNPFGRESRDESPKEPVARAARKSRSLQRHEHEAETLSATVSPTETASQAPLAVAEDRIRSVGQGIAAWVLSAAWVEWITIGAASLWWIISAWLLGGLAVAWCRLNSIRRLAVPAEATTIQTCRLLASRLGLSPPSVLHTPFLPSPCLAGIWKPVVLLPDSELQISLADVLAHELAHLRRHDGRWNLIRGIATRLFWFQPLLWSLSSRMEQAAEEVCDDVVVELGGNRAKYARGLVEVAEFSSVSMAAAGVAIVSFRSMLALRVARIMDRSRPLSTGTSYRLLIGALLAGHLAVLSMGLLGAAPTASSRQPSIAQENPTEKELPTSHGGLPPARDILVAEVPASTVPATPPAKPAFIPGLLSSPAPLIGDRRWQMFSRSCGPAAGSASWSPDGKWLALATGRIVRIYDITNDMTEFTKVLVGHDDFVHSVRYSPQGDRIATASLDGTARIWDAQGREQLVYREHEDAVQDVAWHPDGGRLASASVDGTVRIWSGDGKTFVTIVGHEAPVNAVAWNPNGNWLASGCENKTIRFWTPEGVPGPVLEGHVGAVTSLAWNGDGTRLLSCDHGIEASDERNQDIAHMKLWDTEGKAIDSVVINVPLAHVCWSPDGTRALAGGSRSTWMWPVADRKPVTPMPGAGVKVPVAWRPTGDLIVAGPILLDPNGTQPRAIPIRNVELNSIGVSPDGSTIGIGRADGSFSLFDRDGKQLHQSPSAGRWVHAICWNPNGTSFIAGQRYSLNLQQYDPAGKPLGAAIPLPGDMRSVAWSKDGRYVAAGGDRMIVSLVDLETSKPIAIGKQAHGITQVRFTPDQRQICSAGYDGCIRFWTLDGQPVKVLEAISAPIRGLAWSNDGKLMVTGHEDHLLRFWNSEGELQSVAGGHGDFVESVEFNPAGTQLASGSRDHSVRIWNRDGTPVIILRGHSGAVYAVQWMPDGQHLLSCGDDGAVRMWNVESGKTVWQALFGTSSGYVTLDASGHVVQGDEKILESDFVFFVENGEGGLERTDWGDVRSVLTPMESRSAKAD